jgi:hypothetical protein
LQRRWYYAPVPQSCCALMGGTLGSSCIMFGQQGFVRIAVRRQWLCASYSDGRWGGAHPVRTAWVRVAVGCHGVRHPNGEPFGAGGCDVRGARSSPLRTERLRSSILVCWGGVHSRNADGTYSAVASFTSVVSLQPHSTPCVPLFASDASHSAGFGVDMMLWVWVMVVWVR